MSCPSNISAESRDFGLPIRDWGNSSFRVAHENQSTSIRSACHDHHHHPMSHLSSSHIANYRQTPPRIPRAWRPSSLTGGSHVAAERTQWQPPLPRELPPVANQISSFPFARPPNSLPTLSKRSGLQQCLHVSESYPPSATYGDLWYNVNSSLQEKAITRRQIGLEDSQGLLLAAADSTFQKEMFPETSATNGLRLCEYQPNTFEQNCGIDVSRANNRAVNMRLSSRLLPSPPPHAQVTESRIKQRNLSKLIHDADDFSDFSKNGKSYPIFDEVSERRPKVSSRMSIATGSLPPSAFDEIPASDIDSSLSLIFSENEVDNINAELPQLMEQLRGTFDRTQSGRKVYDSRTTVLHTRDQLASNERHLSSLRNTFESQNEWSSLVPTDDGCAKEACPKPSPVSRILLEMIQKPQGREMEDVCLKDVAYITGAQKSFIQASSQPAAANIGPEECLEDTSKTTNLVVPQFPPPMSKPELSLFASTSGIPVPRPLPAQARPPMRPPPVLPSNCLDSTGQASRSQMQQQQQQQSTTYSHSSHGCIQSTTHYPHNNYSRESSKTSKPILLEQQKSSDRQSITLEEMSKSNKKRLPSRTIKSLTSWNQPLLRGQVENLGRGLGGWNFLLPTPLQTKRAGFMRPVERDSILKFTLSQMAKAAGQPINRATSSSSQHLKLRSTASRQLGSVSTETTDDSLHRFGKTSYASVWQPRSLILIDFKIPSDVKYPITTDETITEGTTTPTIDDRSSVFLGIEAEVEAETDVPTTLSFLTNLFIERIRCKEDYCFDAKQSLLESIVMKDYRSKLVARYVEMLYSIVLQLTDVEWDLPQYPPLRFSDLRHLGLQKDELVIKLFFWFTQFKLTDFEIDTWQQQQQQPVNSFFKLEQLGVQLFKYLTNEIVAASQSSSLAKSTTVPHLCLSVWLLSQIISIEKGRRLLCRMLIILPWSLANCLVSLLLLIQQSRFQKTTSPLPTNFPVELTNIIQLLLSSVQQKTIMSSDSMECDWCRTVCLGDLLTSSTNYHYCLPKAELMHERHNTIHFAMIKGFQVLKNFTS